MLYTGLSKGVMHYAGLGPEKAWTLTDRKGKINSIWELFAERILEIKKPIIFFGKNYFLIRNIDYCPPQNRIDQKHAKRLVTGKGTVDTRLSQVIGCIDTIANKLHGQEVRLFNLFNHRWLFEIISKNYYEELRALGEEKLIRPGLFANSGGFCRISHQRRICRIYKDDPCIFVKKSHAPDEYGTLRMIYHCGRFNQKFAARRIALLTSGKICGRIGECEKFYGFEI